MRGKLILLEGLDKSGKSTQCALLAEALRERGHAVRLQRFPDRSTPIGKMIDAYLRGEEEQEDHVIHLLFCANRWELANSIKASIAANTTVILDRYHLSGAFYSAAKGNPSLPLTWAHASDIGLPAPDACVFLDVPEGVAAARGGGYGEEKYETRQRQREVRWLFGGLEELRGERVVRVDAGKGVEDVAAEVLEVAMGEIERVDADGGELGVVEDW